MTFGALVAGLWRAVDAVRAAVGLGRAVREGVEELTPERTNRVKIREQGAGSSAHSESHNAGRKKQ